MKPDIFRKVALDRLSSPEQLDRTLALTSPKQWTALVALLLLLGVAGVWSVKGSISTTASGEGVIVRAGGVQNVVTTGSGVLARFDVKVGDHIQQGQVIARVAQPALAERIRAANEAISEAERARQVSGEIRKESTRLQLDTIQRQRENALREIRVLQDQERLVSEQIPVEAELLSKGLITRQQTFAAKQKLVDIQGQIAAQNGKLQQLEADQFSARSQPLQADLEAKSKISDLQRLRAGLERELELTANVISPFSGSVIELRAVPGSTVTQGVPLLSLQPDVRQLEALVYVPSTKAKQIVAGMEVQVSPSTVRREEYGYLRGRVTAVADYPATPAALMRNFQNESLVNSLTGAGPVTELRVTLTEDPATPSGYRWSSPLGPPIQLSSGTISTARIITRRQQPITLAIPMMKQTFGLS